MLAAKEIIRVGLRKRVGSGLTVNITRDPWLPVDESPVPIPVVPGLGNFMVNSLFQVGVKAWDQDVVNDLFTDRDAVTILGIPLSAVHR